jgi:hypothetical protein
VPVHVAVRLCAEVWERAVHRTVVNEGEAPDASGPVMAQKVGQVRDLVAHRRNHDPHARGQRL